MSNYSDTVLADSPLLYWRLDDATSSTTAADASGNSNTGTVTSSWTFQQTSQVTGSSFGSNPASTSSRIVSPSIAFGSSGFVTVEMWVNFNGQTGSPTFMLAAFGVNYLDMFVSGGVMGFNTGSGDQYGCALPGSGVHHLVFVFANNANTNTGAIYIDGVAQTLSGSWGSAPAIGTHTFQVAGWTAGGQGIPSAVYIDEVAVYAGALTEDQVYGHYIASTNPPDPFASAIPAEAGDTWTVVTNGFTTETGEDLTCPVAATAWFTFTPPFDGIWRIDTIGSDFDTGLSAYTGTTLAGLSRVAYDDDSGGSGTSRLALEMIGGTQYHLQAGAGPSASPTSGTLKLNVTSPLETYNGFGPGAPPGTAYNGPNQINAGTAFYTTLSGQRCVGARIYVQATASGDPTGAVGYLYAASGGYPTGSPLATASFPTLTKGSWTEVRWSAPVDIAPNTVYYVVAYVKANIYFTILSMFTVDRIALSGAPGLILPADDATHHNGVFADNTSAGTLPNNNYLAEFLGVDVILDGGIPQIGWGAPV